MWFTFYFISFFKQLLGFCENEEKSCQLGFIKLGVRLCRLYIKVVAICLLFLALQIMLNIVVADLRFLKDFK